MDNPQTQAYSRHSPRAEVPAPGDTETGVGMEFHVETVKPLTILHGQENGLLDESLLVTIPDVNAARGLDVTLNKVAAQAWNAMSLAAREAGFDLYPTDLGYGTYRTFSRQVSGFKNHYTKGFIEGRKHKEFPPGTVWSLNLNAEDAGTPGNRTTAPAMPSTLRFSKASHARPTSDRTGCSTIM